MCAILLDILQRDRNIGGVCQLSDLTVAETGTVADRYILEQPNLYLYCLNDASRQAIFIEVPPEISPVDVPFYYQVVFEHALRLVAVSFDGLHRLAADVQPKPQHVVMIHNIGRCGSTLLHNAFNQMNEVVSLSEPDGSRDAELIELAQNCILLTFKSLVQDRTTACVVKMRNQAVEVIDLFYAAFPQASHIFMYRSAVDFVSSFYRLSLKAQFVHDRPRHEVVTQGQNYFNRHEIDIDRYLNSQVEMVTVVEQIALLWLLMMDRALTFHHRGIPMLTVRYEELTAQPEQTLEAVLRYCNLPAAGVNRALQAFERDAQAGTLLARDDAARGNTTKLTSETNRADRSCSETPSGHSIFGFHTAGHNPVFVKRFWF